MCMPGTTCLRYNEGRQAGYGVLRFIFTDQYDAFSPLEMLAKPRHRTGNATAEGDT